MIDRLMSAVELVIRVRLFNVSRCTLNWRSNGPSRELQRQRPEIQSVFSSADCACAEDRRQDDSDLSVTRDQIKRFGIKCDTFESLKRALS